MKKVNFLFSVLLILLGFIVYANSLQNGFVWDDIIYISGDLHITDLKYLKEVFSFPLGHFSIYSDRQGEPFYRPLQSASFIMDYFLWGKEPFGYHLTNVLFHTSTAILLYFFILKLTAKRIVASVTSVIFLIHPVQTAAVTYVSGRADPMAFFFMLAALLFYIKSEGCQNTKRFFYYVFSITTFALALFSKELAMIFPVILFLYDSYQNKTQSGYAKYKKYIPYLLVIIGFFLLHKNITTHIDPQRHGFGLRFMMSGYLLVKYIRLLFLPFGLHMEYKVPVPHLGIMLLSFILLGGIFLLLYANRRKLRFLCFGGIWFLVTLFPMLNVARELNAPMAEHWLYLPIVGFGIIMGVSLDELQRRISGMYPLILSRVLIGFIILGSVVYYSSISIARNLDWRDNITFLKRTLEDAPHSARIAMEMGREYSETGDFGNAETYFKKAINIDPGLKDAHYNLAKMYEQNGNISSAIQQYKNELKRYPKDIKTMNNLGVLYKNVKRFDLAVDQYNNILKEAPNYAPAYYNLGVIFKLAGEYAKANEHFKKTLSIDPNFELAKHALQVIANEQQKP